jgi:hypothetical protein
MLFSVLPFSPFILAFLYVSIFPLAA